ncbi:MAG: beta-lactamase/transpeptidase-like protein [Monoraphidium minutum]|nr:MAG: beta-lactamase/transpeptidase-like protein [Monoraphidium minutum]
MPLLPRLALLLLLAAGALAARPPSPAGASKRGVSASAFAKQIAADRLWAGIAIVTEGGNVVLEEAHGLAVPELGVPLKTDHVVPIGSNSKLFTAVAIWQLQERGKLDVGQPFTKYANMSALGLPKDWCPRLGGKDGKPTGGCLPAPTLEQLLRMSGGIVDASNCEYEAGAWEAQYCLTNATTCFPGSVPAAFYAAVAGAADPAAVLAGTGALLAPFEFAPGSKYHYSNEAYILASHVVEHVSGLPLAAYLQQHIIGPLGLASTFMDVSMGQDGVYKNAVPYPAYIAYMAPLDLGMPASDKAYLGKRTYTSGNVGARGAAPGRWAKTGRAAAPSFGGNDFNFATGAGAVQSSGRDVAKWLRVLTTEPQKLGLSPATLRRMLAAPAATAVPYKGPAANGTAAASALGALAARVEFAQGAVVLRGAKGAKGAAAAGGRLGGVEGVYYKGSLGGFDATYYLVLHPSDASKDVLVFLLTTTDAAGPQDSDHKRVSAGLYGARSFRHVRASLRLQL